MLQYPYAKLSNLSTEVNLPDNDGIPIGMTTLPAQTLCYQGYGAIYIVAQCRQSLTRTESGEHSFPSRSHQGAGAGLQAFNISHTDEYGASTPILGGGSSSFCRRPAADSLDSTRSS